MDKAQEFLAIVQTMFIANAINMTLDDDAKNRRAEFSASGAFIFMDEAVRAAQRIPSDMSSADAANQFAGYMLQSLRESGDTVPAWFAR